MEHIALKSNDFSSLRNKTIYDFVEESIVAQYNQRVENDDDFGCNHCSIGLTSGEGLTAYRKRMFEMPQSNADELLELAFISGNKQFNSAIREQFGAVLNICIS